MHQSRQHFVRIFVIALAVAPIFLALWLPSDAAHAAAGTVCLSSRASGLPKVLSFEKKPSGKLPGGWFGVPTGTITLLSNTEHDGQKVARIERDPQSPSRFSSLTNCIQMDFTGKAITLQGYLRTKNVKGVVGLWVRENESEQVLAFDNMHEKDLHGTTGWKRYSVTLPIKPKAGRLYFGVLLAGTGTAWTSGLTLLVDGKPVWEAPRRKIPPKPNIPFYTDHQFDHGSGISLKKLSEIQIANLAMLGRVWGFLKYYDPTVTSGKRQWDYDLFRIMPKILKAKNQKSADAALVQWVNKLGPVEPCKSCVHLKTGSLQLGPPIDWIGNQKRLGKKLSGQLQNIYKNRRKGKQFYVSQVPGVGNPVFKHELPYSSIKFPDSGFQLLALYRFWNIVEYWYPDRNVIGENWNKVLEEFIPRLATANSRKTYVLQLMSLIAKVHDTHANLWSSLRDRPPIGKCRLPVRIRFVQNQPVVTGYLYGKSADTSPLKIGDVLVKLDGQPVSKLLKKWAPYYGASNEAAFHYFVSRAMTRGNCGDTVVGMRRDSHLGQIEAQRVPLRKRKSIDSYYDDLPGPTFRLLSPKVELMSNLVYGVWS